MLRPLLILTLLLAHASASTNCLLQLRDGNELQGTLLLPQLSVHAPYGTIQVQRDSIAEVNFSSQFEPDTLVTASGNRFSGFINDSIQLKPAIGDPITLKKFEIKSLRLHPFQLESSAPCVVLMNGDLLSGQFSLPAIQLTNTAGRPTLQPQSVDSVWFKKNETAIDVQLTDGRQIRATYPGQSLKLRVASGQDVELPRQLLKIIYWKTGTIPPEVARLAAARSDTNSASNLPPPERMVWVPAGTVLLGSPLDERGRNSDEDPRTHVTISRGFWIGQYEVTQGEYAALMGDNPSTFQGNTNRPVEKVSWHDANDYCARLTESARDLGTLPSGYVYRLPTEAEWEYACRAGTTTRFSFGEDPDERELVNHAWFSGNSGWTTHPVGQLRPNPWGLYDMHGNVLEWCAGLWSQSYPGGQINDYNGPPEGWLRVARGGSWLYTGIFARSANRDDYGAGNRCSDLGFRVVLAAPLQ